jgi:hypothetical protein
MKALLAYVFTVGCLLIPSIDNISIYSATIAANPNSAECDRANKISAE